MREKNSNFKGLISEVESQVFHKHLFSTTSFVVQMDFAKSFVLYLRIFPIPNENVGVGKINYFHIPIDKIIF